MKNVKEAAAARAALGVYHPLWLRLGMEVVVGRSMAGDLMCSCMPCAACLVLRRRCGRSVLRAAVCSLQGGRQAAAVHVLAVGL